MPSSDKPTGKVFRLQVEPNNYPWGPVGLDSFAARLTPNASAPGRKVDKDKEYAELWMGTHPTSPAKLYDSEILLSDHLQENQALLGTAGKFKQPYKGEEGNKGHVPFLFKILCCKQALPLQIHPNKKLAEQLNKENPEQFADTNHKPEIAVCLSERFLGFAAFRPLAQIKDMLLGCPEVKNLPQEVGTAVDAFLVTDVTTGMDRAKEQLRKTWHAFLDVSGDKVESAVNAFCDRVKRDGASAFNALPSGSLTEGEKGNMVDAVHVLDKYNRGDGSIFASLLFMNLVELKKGEGMYVGADGIHAWLLGDIVELMAASDNVLNVGFTPEKDSTSLVAKTIDVNPRPANSILLRSKPFSKGTQGHTTVYATPFEEFAILRIQGSETLKPLSGPGVLIVPSEEEMHVKEKGADIGAAPSGGGMGSVYFIGAGAELEVSGKGEAWMAFYDGDKESEDQVGAQ